MTLPLTSTDAQIIRLTEGLFDLRPGYTYLSDFRSYVEDNNINSFADALINFLGAPSDQELTDLIVVNLGLTGDAATVATEYLLGQFAANPNNRGMVTSQSLDIFSTLVNDDTFGAAAEQFNADVAASLTYSSNPNNTQVTGSENSDSVMDLTVLNDNLVGTSRDNTFNADVVQNSLGEQTNELASGDYINGGAGTDALWAEVQPASPNNAGPSGSIKPITVDVEQAWFTALETRGFTSSNGQTVVINAKDMLGLDAVASYQSDASLLIENLTTLMDDGVYENRRNTEEVTIVMDHSGNDIAVDAESDMTVLFDNDYLLAGQTSLAQAFYWLLDEKAELAGNELRLAEIDTNGLIFDIDGEIYTVASEAARLAGTHEGFVAALQEELANAQAAGEVPESVSISLNYEIIDTTGLDDGSLSGPIPAIVVATNSGVLTPIGFSKPEGLTGDYDVYGQFDNEFAQDNLPVVATIALEKVGRGAEGGDLTVGGMATDMANIWDYSDSAIKEGIEVFNISVSGDDTQDSSVASLQSTNNTLTGVNVVSAAGSTADLFIGNHNTNMMMVNGTSNNDDDVTTLMNSALKDVRDFNAAGFANDLSLYAYVSDESVAKYMDLTDTAADPAADNADFKYTFGAGNDMLNINISKTNLAQSGSTNREDFSLDINGGAGNDTIETQIGDGETNINGAELPHWYQNSKINANLMIDAGSGNDVVRAWGSGSWIVDLGTGNDVMYSDNSGNQMNQAFDISSEMEDGADLNYNQGRATWVLNTADQNPLSGAVVARDIDNLLSDANNNYALFNATVTVNLKGLTATAVIDEYNTTDLELNNIIKDIIQNDEFLSDLIVAEDGPANTLVIRSLTDGDFTASNVSVSVTPDNDFSLNDAQISAFNAANGTSITTLAGVYDHITSDRAAWNTKGDYRGALANDGIVELTGVDSDAATSNTITDGTGRDTIVASTSINDNTDTIILVADGQRDVVYNLTNATVDYTLVSGVKYQVSENNNGYITISTGPDAQNLTVDTQLVMSNGSTYGGYTEKTTTTTDADGNEVTTVTGFIFNFANNGTDGPIDPPIDPPVDLTPVVLPVAQGDSVDVTANPVPELFTMDVVTAEAQAANTQINLSQFSIADDFLQFDIATPSAQINTLDQLNGYEGISVTPDEINNQTVVDFGFDGDNDVIILALVGITDASQVNIDLI
jgi:hypothetical protein